MNAKKCLKCNHVTNYDGAPPQACPSCGAIYAKVEAAVREGAPSRLQAQIRKRSSPSDHHEFVDQMRAESVYPAFRTVVGIIYWVGIVLAILSFVGGVVGSYTAKIGPGPAIAGLVMAILIYIIFRVGKEVSLMLADLSDATIRMAASQPGKAEQ